MPRKKVAPRRQASTRVRNFKCGQVYHVLQRSSFGRTTFHGPEEMAIYLNHFFFLCRRHKVRVHNFCLMKTHIHFVLEQQRRCAISKLMRDLQGLHTRKQNARLQTFGNLWNLHYGCKHVDTVAYYRTLMWYVTNNPVKAGLVKRVEEYAWSGARALAANGPVQLQINETKVPIPLYLVRYRQQCQPETWTSTSNAPLPTDLQQEYETVEQILDGMARLLFANQQRILRQNEALQNARAKVKHQRTFGPGRRSVRNDAPIAAKTTKLAATGPPS